MIKHHCFRLVPNQDLKQELIDYVLEHQIKAAALVACVGSLSKLNIRLASANHFMQREELFEIVSLSGTICADGAHLHISVADQNGVVVGGHLLNNNIIHTTAELVLLELEEVFFNREFDLATGYPELKITRLSN